MLMDQSVIVCTSTTRPSVPHEGMLIYEVDSNGFKWYNGSTWAALGSAIDAWVSGSDLSVPGNLSAVGTLTSGAATVASLTATGDVSARGSTVTRLVDGKVGSGSTATPSSSTTPANIIGANAQNVSVISGRAYRAAGQISMLGAAAGDRITLQLWDGTVGGTKLGADVNCKVETTAGSYRSYAFQFLWSAASTQTMSNVNLSLFRLTGSGAVQAQVDGNYFMTIEELGPASLVSGL